METTDRALANNLSDFDVTPTEAVALQRVLAEKVRIAPLARWPATIAGVDVSVREGMAQAAVVVLDMATLQPLARAIWREPVRFPYVSGLLSFREIPPLLRALAQLPELPDAIMCDGQGIAHPRRLGLAAHLGVLLNLPTVGAAKSRLIGSADDPAIEAGSQTPLLHKGETIGVALRTRTGVKPLFVSAGHLVTLDDAIALVLHCVTRYRMPETTRLAHLASRGELP